MMAAVALLIVYSLSLTPAPSSSYARWTLASRLVGLNIQNTGNDNIGEIYDTILTDGGAVKAYIVSVGGFLGMGTRYVAIDPKAVTLARQDEKNWKATMNANKDQLKDRS